MAAPDRCCHTFGMELLNRLLARLTYELMFSFAWLGLFGWLGYEWAAVLLDRFIQQCRQVTGRFGTGSLQ